MLANELEQRPLAYSTQKQWKSILQARRFRNLYVYRQDYSRHYASATNL